MMLHTPHHPCDYFASPALYSANINTRNSPSMTRTSTPIAQKGAIFEIPEIHSKSRPSGCQNAVSVFSDVRMCPPRQFGGWRKRVLALVSLTSSRLRESPTNLIPQERENSPNPLGSCEPAEALLSSRDLGPAISQDHRPSRHTV